MPNINEDHPDKYWLEISDLTIFQAAFWMQINSDPRTHDDRYARDPEYKYYFDDNPAGSDAVDEKCFVLESLIRTGEIKTTKEIYYGDQKLDLDLTRINKSDWLKWCYHNGYKERFAQTAPAVIVEAVPIAPTVSDPLEQAPPAAKGQDVPVKSPSGDNTELPPAKAGGLAQLGATTKVVNRTCPSAHESTHDSQSHRLKPVVFTKCVDNKPISTANQVYWRVILNSEIKKIDNGKKTNVRGIIKYLRGLGDNRLPDKGVHDELFWIDDNDTERRVGKKTVSTAASSARKLP